MTEASAGVFASISLVCKGVRTALASVTTIDSGTGLGHQAREDAAVDSGHDPLLVSLADDRAGVDDVLEQDVEVAAVDTGEVGTDLLALAEQLVAVQAELGHERLALGGRARAAVWARIWVTAVMRVRCSHGSSRDGRGPRASPSCDELRVLVEHDPPDLFHAQILGGQSGLLDRGEHRAGPCRPADEHVACLVRRLVGIELYCLRMESAISGES